MSLFTVTWCQHDNREAPDGVGKISYEWSRSPISRELYGSLIPPYGDFVAGLTVIMAPARRHQLNPQEI